MHPSFISKNAVLEGIINTITFVVIVLVVHFSNIHISEVTLQLSLNFRTMYFVGCNVQDIEKSHYRKNG